MANRNEQEQAFYDALTKRLAELEDQFHVEVMAQGGVVKGNKSKKYKVSEETMAQPWFDPLKKKYDLRTQAQEEIGNQIEKARIANDIAQAKAAGDAKRKQVREYDQAASLDKPQPPAKDKPQPKKPQPPQSDKTPAAGKLSKEEQIKKLLEAREKARQESKSIEEGVNADITGQPVGRRTADVLLPRPPGSKQDILRTGLYPETSQPVTPPVKAPPVEAPPPPVVVPPPTLVPPEPPPAPPPSEPEPEDEEAKKRSAAAKKGWETRRRKEAEAAQKKAEAEAAKQKRQEAKRAKEATKAAEEEAKRKAEEEAAAKEEPKNQVEEKPKKPKKAKTKKAKKKLRLHLNLQPLQFHHLSRR